MLCALTSTGNGVPACEGNCAQGPKDEEHISGQGQGRHYRLWALQRHQTLPCKQVGKHLNSVQNRWFICFFIVKYISFTPVANPWL